jgi:hypothetical protein
MQLTPRVGGKCLLAYHREQLLHAYVAEMTVTARLHARWLWITAISYNLGSESVLRVGGEVIQIDTGTRRGEVICGGGYCWEGGDGWRLVAPLPAIRVQIGRAARYRALKYSSDEPDTVPIRRVSHAPRTSPRNACVSLDQPWCQPGPERNPAASLAVAGPGGECSRSPGPSELYDHYIRTPSACQGVCHLNFQIRVAPTAS